MAALLVLLRRNSAHLHSAGEARAAQSKREDRRRREVQMACVQRCAYMAIASVESSTTSHLCVPASTSAWPSVDLVAGLGASASAAAASPRAGRTNDIFGLTSLERERWLHLSIEREMKPQLVRCWVVTKVAPHAPSALLPPPTATSWRPHPRPLSQGLTHVLSPWPHASEPHTRCTRLHAHTCMRRVAACAQKSMFSSLAWLECTERFSE